MTSTHNTVSNMHLIIIVVCIALTLCMTNGTTSLPPLIPSLNTSRLSSNFDNNLASSNTTQIQSFPSRKKRQNELETLLGILENLTYAFTNDCKEKLTFYSDRQYRIELMLVSREDLDEGSNKTLSQRKKIKAHIAPRMSQHIETRTSLLKKKLKLEIKNNAEKHLINDYDAPLLHSPSEEELSIEQKINNAMILVGFQHDHKELIQKVEVALDFAKEDSVEANQLKAVKQKEKNILQQIEMEKEIEMNKALMAASRRKKRERSHTLSSLGSMASHRHMASPKSKRSVSSNSQKTKNKIHVTSFKKLIELREGELAQKQTDYDIMLSQSDLRIRAIEIDIAFTKTMVHDFFKEFYSAKKEEIEIESMCGDDINHPRFRVLNLQRAKRMDLFELK